MKIARARKVENIDWIPANVMWHKFLYLLRGKRLVNLDILVNRVPFSSTAWKAHVVSIW